MKWRIPYIRIPFQAYRLPGRQAPFFRQAFQSRSSLSVLYAAIEKGYFEEEGIALELVTGYGADKTMTAVLSGEAQIGFMGSESSIYTYRILL